MEKRATRLLNFKRLLILTIISLFLILEVGFAYEYEIVEITELDKVGSGINTRISPDTKIRYFGAVVVSDSPFSLGITLDNKLLNEKTVRIESISISKNKSSETYLEISPEQIIQGSWVNRGVLSIWHPEPTFDLQVAEQEKICTSIYLREENIKTFTVEECFLFQRKKGSRSMKIKDILNQ